ncbi:hypothetical protein EV714DRAFT_285772 [Schizophyllum commune]
MMEDDLCRTVRGRAARLIPLLHDTAEGYTHGEMEHSQAMVNLSEGQLVRAHLAAHIAELTRTLDALDLGIATCRTAVVPVNKLPPEILGEVFACVIHEAACATDVRRGPWLLSHVCHRWRALVRDTPALWTVVDVGDHAFSRRNAHNLVKTYLKRSAKLLVTCSLSASPSQPVAAVETLLNVLLLYSARWRSACFALDAICFDRLMPPPKPGFAALESVELHLTGKPDSAGAPPLGNPLFAAAPRLRRALVSGTQHRAFSFPWKQLEYYVGQVVTYDGRCVLPEMRALQRCSPSVHATRPIPQPATPHLLPSLTKLCANHGTIIDAIATPMLAECAFGSGPRLEQISALLQRSACSLRILRLIDNPIPLDGVLNLLQLCPDLRELAIGCMLRADVEIYCVLTALMPRQDGSSLVPALERLAFSPFQNSFNCTPYVELARSRSPAAGGRLLSISILLSQCTLDNADSYDALRRDAPNLGLQEVILVEDFGVSDDIVNSWLDV